MSYSNITVVTSQGTFGYQPGTPFVPISYNTLDLIPDIPHNAQLEVERIFSMDRAGDTNAIPNFLNDTNVSVVDKQRVFIIPTDRITYNINTKQITDILLPSSGNDVYNFAYTPISGPNVGQPQSILVPQLRIGDNIIVRRKTVSNTPLVLWTAGSKLTTAQLNLNTTQLLFLAQELNNKIAITSVSTEQILDNAITTAKILNGAVTSDKLFDLNGPKRLLGSGNVSANVDGKYDVQELTLGDGFFWDANSTVLQVAPVQPGQRVDINVVEPNTNWTINPNAVTYAKMQDVSGSRLLGRGSSGSGDPQELSVANSLTISGTQLSVTTPLTDGNKTDITVGSNGTTFTLNNSVVDTVELANNAVTYGKMQLSNQSNRVLGSTAAGTTIQELQVQTDMVANAAITNDKLAADAVDTPNIQNNAVTTAKINSDAVTYGKMQKMSTANRVLGTTTPNTNPTEVQVQTDMVANNAVTFGKMQQIATNTLLGRSSAGTGNVETISVSSAGRDLIDDSTVSDMRQTLQLGTAALSATTDFALAAHTHGNITSGGLLGTTANVPLITGSGGLIQAGSFGTAANTFCQGNDSRLSDARTPTAHTHSAADITSGSLGVSQGGTGLTTTPTNGQLLIGNNSGFTLATLTAGTGIGINNQAGAITISITGSPQAPDLVLVDGTYGDISIVSTTWTVVNNAITTNKIANGAVSFAKIQNINTNTLLGRASAGSGVVEEITLTAAGRNLLDDADATAQRSTLGLGSSATLNVPTSGNATNSQVVLGNDTRLTDTRTPTDNTVSTAKVQDLAITTDKLAAGAVTGAKITNHTVTLNKLPTVVTANRVLGGSSAGATVSEVEISTDYLANSAVTTAKIADGNVTSGKLAAGAAAANLGNLGVTTALLNDNAVTTAKITDLNVTTDKLANNAVTYGKMQTIATGNRLLGSTTSGGAVSEVQVAEAMIATNAVTSDKINASAVVEAKIASNAVTTAKILDRNVTFIKLPASTTANRVLAATASGVSFSELQVQTDMIADAAITAAKIAPGAITISANDLAAGSITASLLATDSVITAKIQNGAVTNEKIANRAGNSVMGRASNTAGAVADITASTSGHALRFDGTNVGFGTIPEAGIANGAITTNKIGDAQVTGAKILDGAVTAAKLNTTPKKVIEVLTVGSGTWTVPTNIKNIYVQVWGGGGGGGTYRQSSNTNPVHFAGGNGGQTTACFNVVENTVFNYTVGNGGTTGGAGASSTFLGITATGGTSATVSSSGSNGTDGTVSISNIPSGATLVTDYKRFYNILNEPDTVNYLDNRNGLTTIVSWSLSSYPISPGRGGGQRSPYNNLSGTYQTAGTSGAIVIEYYLHA